MRLQSKNVVFLIGAGLTLGALGCSLPPSRVGFIEKISAANRRIARSTRSFHSAVNPLKKGEAADTSQARSAYQEMEKTVKEVRAEMDAQSLPPGSSSAKAFLSAYKEYLNAEQKILTDDLQPIVKKVEEPGAPASKAPFVNGMLAKVKVDEDAAYAPLIEAQKSYASEHNYTVQSLESYIEAQKNGKQ